MRVVSVASGLRRRACRGCRFPDDDAVGVEGDLVSALGRAVAEETWRSPSTLTLEFALA